MGRLAWVRIFVLTSALGGGACLQPASLDGRVCPCAEGYRCCELLMTLTDVPAPRGYHTAVWTGGEMIVWGGVSTSLRLTTVVLNDGGRYDPKTDRWSPVYTSGSGGPRAYHTGVWAENPDHPGGKLIVWGGLDQIVSAATRTPGGGALYDPTADRWSPLAVAGAPSPRAFATAVWTGRQMILWGGVVINAMERSYLADGALYSP